MKNCLIFLISLSGLLPFANAQIVTEKDLSEEAVTKYNLPYKNTYVNEALVAENEFRTAKPTIIQPKSFAEARDILPKPEWDGHAKELKMYWRAWEIAVGNIRQPLIGSGFVSPYLDVAYNGNIFMWYDAFMIMFARYGYRFFPFQGTLDNFYSKQHPEGFICREIKRDGANAFERYDPVSTGPNLLPWAEMMYYKQFGDEDRLNKVFPVLSAYYKWLKVNHTWYKNVLEAYKKTGTVWEYYAPESADPGFMAKDEFVGWGGLPPIAVFIEYILGIQSDFSEKTVSWDMIQTDKHGIERNPFGPDGVVSLIADKCSRQMQNLRSLSIAIYRSI